MKDFLTGWIRSVVSAFSGGHFHWTPGLIGFLAAGVVVTLVSLRFRGLTGGEPDPRSHSGAAVVGGLALVVGVVLLLDRHAPAAVKAAAKPAVTHTTVIQRHTTIVQHVAASHSAVTGTEITVMIIVALFAWLAAVAIRRGR
jgi:hypothetical protein